MHISNTTTATRLQIFCNEKFNQNEVGVNHVIKHHCMQMSTPRNDSATTCTRLPFNGCSSLTDGEVNDIVHVTSGSFSCLTTIALSDNVTANCSLQNVCSRT
jgi:hypothetical protein